MTYGVSFGFKNIEFFSIYPLQTVSQIETVQTDLSSISWSCDNNVLCYSCTGGLVSLEMGTDVHKKLVDSTEQIKVSFAKTTNFLLASAGCNGISSTWIYRGHEFYQVKKIKHFSHKLATTISFNNDDSIIALACHSGNSHVIQLFDTNDTYTAIKQYNLTQNEKTMIIQFNPYSKSNFIAATNIGTVKLFDMSFDNPLFSLKTEINSFVCGLEFIKSSRDQLFVAYQDNSVLIYDLSQRKTVQAFSICTKINSFTLINENQFLVSTIDGVLYQYDIRSQSTPLESLTLRSRDCRGIIIQTGSPVDPRKYTDSIEIHSDKALEYKLKRSAKDPSHVTPSVIAKKNKFKSIRTLFSSPANKKNKIYPIQESYSPQIETQPYDSSNPIITQTPQEPENDDKIQPTSLTESLQFETQKTIDTDQSTDLKNIDEQINELINKHESFHIQSESTLMDIKYYIHSQIRDLHIDLIRQSYYDTTQIKQYFSNIVNEMLSKERELVDENHRLRDEILYLRSFIKKSNDKSTQSNC